MKYNNILAKPLGVEGMLQSRDFHHEMRCRPRNMGTTASEIHYINRSYIIAKKGNKSSILQIK